MARSLKFLLIFVLGAIVGAVGMAYLASRASFTYARSLEASYSFEQQRQAALGAKRGQWLQVAMAYNNMVAAGSKIDKPFGVERQGWELSFPLASLVLESMLETDIFAKGRRVSLGVSYARYAYALEKSGHVQEAAIAWEGAMKSSSFKSIEAARNLAVQLLNQDVEFFSEH